MNEERWHGTRGGYSNHACRCEACTKAISAGHLRYMQNNPVQRQKALDRQRLRTAQKNGFSTREEYEASRGTSAVLVSCPFCNWAVRTPASWMKNGRVAGYHAHVREVHPPIVDSASGQQGGE